MQTFRCQSKVHLLDRIFQFFQSLNQGRWPVLVFVGAVISLGLLSLRDFPVAAPDGKLFYNQQYLQQFLCLDVPPPTTGDDLGTCGASCQRVRWIYIATQLSLDTVLPLSYGTLMGILIVRCFPGAIARRYIIVPILVSVLDLTENFILVWLAITWKCGTSLPPLFQIAPWVSGTKWTLAGVCLAVLLVGWFQKRGTIGASTARAEKR